MTNRFVMERCGNQHHSNNKNDDDDDDDDGWWMMDEQLKMRWDDEIIRSSSVTWHDWVSRMLSDLLKSFASRAVSLWRRLETFGQTYDE